MAGKRAALCFCKSKLTVEAVQRLALLAYKERLAGRFHPGTHALTALSSSLRRGCVVDKPSFNRATCNTRLSVSTWSSFNSRASVPSVLGHFNQPFNLARGEMLPLTNLSNPRQCSPVCGV